MFTEHAMCVGLGVIKNCNICTLLLKMLGSGGIPNDSQWRDLTHR